MTSTLSFADYCTRLRDFIERSSTNSRLDESSFNDLAKSIFALQFNSVAPYRRFCESRKISPATLSQWSDIPAVPTSAFKDLELTSLSPEERKTVFHSSGTTEQRPSRHFHSAESFSVYEASLLPQFQKHFLGDWDALAENEIIGPINQCGFIILTPSPALAPNSSLVHMFETVRREFGSRDSFFAGRLDAGNAWTLDLDQVLFGIRKSMCANRPVAIVGTAFSFVHLLDHFTENNMRYKLATGSRVLETGGYKGRSRSMPKSELHQLITKHLGIPASHIICEYGMSELSSQAYDRTIDFSEPSFGQNLQTLENPKALDLPSHFVNSVNSVKKSPELNVNRTLYFPPWARVQIVSPETGREVAEGETGLIRIFDLANVRSVMAIQTEDLGIRRGDGFELIGRAALAEVRGCSLMHS